MRKQDLHVGQFYHVYNRGVDKRDIFLSTYDFDRFLQCLSEFNTTEPVGSLYELSFANTRNKLGIPGAKFEKLVDITAYCLNMNHFHFILRQRKKDGISKFMMKVGGGYGRYFNNKHERLGVLFQGRFKVNHIDSNEYLLHLSAYINLNNRVHGVSDESKFRSSWNTYVGKHKNKGFVEKKIVLSQFPNSVAYKLFAENSLRGILENKEKLKELELSVKE